MEKVRTTIIEGTAKAVTGISVNYLLEEVAEENNRHYNVTTTRNASDVTIAMDFDNIKDALDYLFSVILDYTNGYRMLDLLQVIK